MDDHNLENEFYETIKNRTAGNVVLDCTTMKSTLFVV